jgi:hypothetical protein
MFRSVLLVLKEAALTVFDRLLKKVQVQGAAP